MTRVRINALVAMFCLTALGMLAILLALHAMGGTCGDSAPDVPSDTPKEDAKDA